MAQRTKLAAVLSGLVRNVDLTADELVLDSVRLGGLSGTLLTQTILDGLITNSHASGSDNQNIVAGSGLSGGGSGASVTLDVNVDGTTIEINADALRVKDGAISAAKLAATAITGQTAETSADNADLILIYDDSAAALRKMTRANFLAGVTGSQVKVSAADTTSGYLDDSLTAGAGLSKSITNPGADESLDLSVNVDNSTIEISSDALRVKDGGITNAKVASGIDAVKIGAGSVDNTEFGYLDGVTSSIQTQLNGKANTALSNVASTAVSADLLPDGNGTRALGNSSFNWGTFYAGSINATNLLAKTVGSEMLVATLFNNGGSSGNVRLQTGGGGGTVTSGDVTLITGAASGTRGKINLDGLYIDANSTQVRNVADPTAAQHAATKAYVDSLIDGRDWKQSVLVATTANITLSGEQTIDGVLTSASRVLVKDQTAPAENGIYVSAAGAWSRASDADTGVELVGAAVFVEQGTANADKQYAQTADSITLGTTAISWVVTSANSFSGHDMISLSGGQISVDLASDAGLESSNAGNASGQLRVKLDGSTLSRSASGLKVSDAGITATQLAASVAGNGLSGGAGSALSVNVDDSTIEINTDTLRVKDAGITLAKLAANSVDENKITTSVAGAGLTGGGGTALAVGAGDGITVNANDVAVNATAIAGSGLENDGSNNLRIATGAYDQSTITGGGGSAAAVAYSPLVKKSMVAGEAFAADTSFLVRLALTGETAGRVYKATNAAAPTDGKFWAIGIAVGTGQSAGGAIDVILLGSHTLGASDAAFASGDVGKPVWLTTAGGFSVTAPSATDTAAFRIGNVETTTKIFVDGKQLTGVN